jgi:phosphatidylserine/phosphatidylglycerophosphate/cardiolipin synthase-like enzyme
MSELSPSQIAAKPIKSPGMKWVQFFIILTLFTAGTAQSDPTERSLDFQKLSDHFAPYFSGALIKGDVTIEEAVDPTGAPATAPISFIERDQMGVWRTSTPISPDFTERLFGFNWKEWAKQHGTGSFLDAKWDLYRSLSYSLSNKSYDLNTPSLEDWGGLNHPPIRDPIIDDTKLAASGLSQNPRNTLTFQVQLDEETNSELTSKNKITPFLDGNVVPALLELIQHSTQRLWATALLVTCDPGTLPIMEAMKERAKAGIDVRLMVDATMQGLQPGSCLRDLNRNGVKVIKVPGMITHGSAFHIKLWVSDLKKAIIPGANLTEAQTRANGFNHLFHDSGITIEGPLVTDIASQFLELWGRYGFTSTNDPETLLLIKKLRQAETSQKIRGQENYENWLKEGAGLCRVITQERHTDRERVSKAVAKHLSTSQNRVWFNTVRRDFHDVRERPDKGYNAILLQLIQLARDQGVDVEMMLNAVTHPFTPYLKNNTGLSMEGRKTLINRLILMNLNHSSSKALSDGMRFLESANQEAPKLRAWSYFNYSHVKNLIIDDDFILAGSYNPIDERSTNDAELSVFCYDRNLNQQISTNLKRDLMNSLPYPFLSQLKPAPKN